MNFKSSADGPSSSIASAVGDSSWGKYFQYKSEIADEAEVLVNYLVALFYKKEEKSFLGSCVILSKKLSVDDLKEKGRRQSIEVSSFDQPFDLITLAKRG